MRVKRSHSKNPKVSAQEPEKEIKRGGKKDLNACR